MEKKTTSKSLSGAKGGSTKMFGKAGAAPAPAGTSSPPHAMGDKFAKGGSGKMFGEGYAAAQTPGQSSSNHSGNNSWGVKGGNGKMFGPQSAGPATAGSSVK